MTSTPRLVPYLVEATIIPTAQFSVLLVVGDMRWALVGALGWSLTDGRLCAATIHPATM